ncbi:MAG: MBL fold metallo-hydrolase [Phycisphaerales bacterium]|nr:MBL fold metallo-hydrolase [Phycisphaerales bacterium]
MSGPRLTLLGAAGEVTGSCTLVDMGERRILVDLGMIQGESEAERRNAQLPAIDTRWLDAMVLTHAHIDHVGRAPMLIASDWTGPIFCSPPTADLLALTLRSSARLQQTRLREWQAKRDRRPTKQDQCRPPQILFDMRQVDAFLERVVPLPFGKPVDLGGGVSLELGRSGHVLGAAWVLLQGPGGRVVCSGDVGRWVQGPIPPPEPCPSADMVLLESTTAAETTTPEFNVDSELARIVAAAVHRGGPIIAPTFALGRSQQLLWTFSRLQARGLLDINVYLDAALASAVTATCKEWPDELTQPVIDLTFDGMIPLRSRQAARRLDDVASAAIIMAGNGFGEGGPILRHLARWLPSPDATILLTGYAMPGTLVGHLASDPHTALIDGVPVEIQARIEQVAAFGGHARPDELQTWLTSNCQPEQVVLNHGTVEARAALQERLGTHGLRVMCPSVGETVMP